MSAFRLTRRCLSSAAAAPLLCAIDGTAEGVQDGAKRWERVRAQDDEQARSADIPTRCRSNAAMRGYATTHDV